MSVNYKIYKSNRKGTGNGMYYARASHRGTATVNDLAKTMEANSTVKRSDILAVLSELSETMRNELNQGNRVKTLLKGVRVQEASEYVLAEEEEGKE